MEDGGTAADTAQVVPVQVAALTKSGSCPSPAAEGCLQLESVVLTTMGQPGAATVTLLPNHLCTTTIPTVLAEPVKAAIVRPQLVGIAEEVTTTTAAADVSVENHVAEHHTLPIHFEEDSSTVADGRRTASGAAAVLPGRRGGRRTNFRYVFRLAAVEDAGLRRGLVTDCVRALVDFAYCGGALAVTEETYPVLHELSKLLQMEEAVTACEKHAVDRLVGQPDPEPPPPPSVERPQRQAAPAETGQLCVCRSCSFFCHGAARMQRHRRMHHVRSYMCAHCGVTRQKASQLLRHLIKADHGETVCSLCFHECSPGESMMSHYLRHNDPRPFFCSVCFARFPSRTGLNLHMPTHSSLRPFVCRACGQAFKWRHALQSHVRTHGAEKQLLCDVCGYSTRHTGQFKAHRARHAGLTLACPQPGCTVRADTAWLLKDHLVTHAADKQYQCEVCGKKFGHVRNMRRHALLHGQRRQLACPSCPYQSTRSDKLEQHRRTKHRAEPRPEPGRVAAPAAAAEPRLASAARRRRSLRPAAPRRDRTAPPPTAAPAKLRLLLPKPEPEGGQPS